MRPRSRIALLAVVALTATALGQPPVPPPQPTATRTPATAEDGPEVCFEVHVIHLPAGAPLAGCPATEGEVAFLTDAQLKAALEAVQLDRRAGIVQAPKVIAADGQEAVVQTTQQQTFVTALEAKRVNGTVMLVPKNTTVDLGTVMTLGGRVSADRKSVAVRVSYSDTRVEGNVEMVPVVSQLTPVFEGGSQGKPVPFTQFLQAPQIETLSVEKKDLVVPSGGHAVIGGPTFVQEERFEKKVPLLGDVASLGRMFRSYGIAKVKMRTLLVVSPTAIVNDEPAAKSQPAPVVFRLRNVAAGEAARAVNEQLAREKLGSAVLTPEPVSNVVLVAGEAGVQERAVQLLTALDKETPQVLVQALVMKVPAGFARDTGLTEGDETHGVLTPREVRMFAVALRDAKTRDKVDILSRPQLQVADNQTGFVQVGQQVPQAAAGQAVQTVEYQPTGLTARVTPRVMPDGKVLLRAELQLTEPAADPVNLGNGVTAPAFNTQSVQTTALLADGGTLLIRGPVTKAADGKETETLVLLTVQGLVRPGK